MHLLLFLHSQGEKGNESEAAIEERIRTRGVKILGKSGLTKQQSCPRALQQSDLNRASNHTGSAGCRIICK